MNAESSDCYLKKMPFPVVEGIRPGLFVLRFTSNDVENGEHNFHLRKCDYHSYTLVVTRPDAGEDLSISLVKSLSSKMKTLPVGSSPFQDVAKTGQVDKSNLDELAQFVWVMQDGESKPKHLQLQSPTNKKNDVTNSKRTWGPVKCSLGKSFDLWLDFGTESTGEKRVLNQWSSLLTQQNNTDVEFNVQGELMGAHSLILKATSSAFASIVHSRTPKIKPSHVVNVNDVDPQVFQQLLHYIYTGRVPLIDEEGMAERLYKAATKFGLENLKDECVRFVLTNLTVNNVVNVLIWSCNNCLTNLHEYALNFVALHYSQVCQQPDWKLIDTYPLISLKISQLVSNNESVNRGT